MIKNELPLGSVIVTTEQSPLDYFSKFALKVECSNLISYVVNNINCKTYPLHQKYIFI